MLSWEASEHVSWEAGNTLFPLFLLGSVSPIVLGSIEGTMSVGSKAIQMSSIVEAISTAAREVTRNIRDSGASFLASDPGNRPAICHISTGSLPTPFRNSTEDTPPVSVGRQFHLVLPDSQSRPGTFSVHVGDPATLS